MDIIADIFEALGGPTAISVATGAPVQTVHSWKVKGRIPHWRRAPLLKVKPADGKAISSAAIAYLKSSDRNPPRPAASGEVA